MGYVRVSLPYSGYDAVVSARLLVSHRVSPRSCQIRVVGREGLEPSTSAVAGLSAAPYDLPEIDIDLRCRRFYVVSLTAFLPPWWIGLNDTVGRWREEIARGADEAI